MEIKSIVGPVSLVEAKVLRKLDRYGDLLLGFAPGYHNPFGIIQPSRGIKPEEIIGQNIVVHCGRVYVNHQGKLEEREGIIRAYTLDGRIIADHAPEFEYLYSKKFVFDD